MKYEADIIKEIVDIRGHEKTSIHYQSECVEEWVKEVEGAYPKLCDYQPEWLNYSNENKIGVFPYITLTGVTSATVENVVPYAYKSAILSGCTKWANANGDVFDTFFNPITEFNFENGYLLTDGTLTYDDGHFATQFIDVTNFDGIEIGKDGTYYGKLCFYDSDKNFISWVTKEGTTGIVKVTSIPSNAKYIRYSATTKDIFIKDNEGRDLSLPLSLVSVKMPGLTTTGKNLFDGKLEKGSIYTTTGQNANAEALRSDYIKVEPNASFIITNNFSYSSLIFLYDDNKNYIQSLGDKKNVSFTIPSNCRYIRFRSNIDEVDFDVKYQLEQGTQSSSYEPFKSNILSTSDDVELRGIGDVRDELNLLTGEVTERIGEIVLDGSEGWVYNTNNFTAISNNQIVKIDSTVDDMKIDIICDKLPSVKIGDGIRYYSNNGRIYIQKQFSSKQKFLEWLSTEKPTIQYQLATDSVKTVDLSIVDQDGNEREQIKPIEGTMHLNTSGESINPLFSGEVPVEAITQNLASFIEE